MEIGTTLKQREQQYNATFDKTARLWRILDTWHPSLQTLSPDDDVPDSHPAMTLVSEGKFIALVKEATAQGILENAALRGGLPFEVADTGEKDKEIARLKEELSKTKQEPPSSESFRLKRHIVDSLSKLAQSENIVAVEK